MAPANWSRTHVQDSRMSKAKVFVTRVIPAAGLDRVREFCDADVWSEPLPPS